MDMRPGMRASRDRECQPSVYRTMQFQPRQTVGGSGHEDRPRRPTHFNFESLLLREPNSEFFLDESRDPRFRTSLGEHSASRSITQVRQLLDPSARSVDHRLLQYVAPALRYVRRVRADDPIPSEILSGEPSWSVGEHHQRRAIRLVWRALSLELGLDEAEDGNDATIDQMVEKIASRSTDDERKHIERMLDNIIGSISRTSWLRNAVITLQRTIGDLAQASAEIKERSHATLARNAALMLRDVSKFATERVLRLDMLASDVQSALRDPGTVESRVWPLISEQRSLAIDYERVVLAWKRGSGARDQSVHQKIESVYRLCSQRYQEFDPMEFAWSAPFGGEDPG